MSATHTNNDQRAYQVTTTPNSGTPAAGLDPTSPGLSFTAQHSDPTLREASGGTSFDAYGLNSFSWTDLPAILGGRHDVSRRNSARRQTGFAAPPPSPTPRSRAGSKAPAIGSKMDRHFDSITQKTLHSIDQHVTNPASAITPTGPVTPAAVSGDPAPPEPAGDLEDLVPESDFRRQRDGKVGVEEALLAPSCLVGRSPPQMRSISELPAGSFLLPVAVRINKQLICTIYFFKARDGNTGSQLNVAVNFEACQTPIVVRERRMCSTRFADLKTHRNEAARKFGKKSADHCLAVVGHRIGQDLNVWCAVWCGQDAVASAYGRFPDTAVMLGTAVPGRNEGGTAQSNIRIDYGRQNEASGEMPLVLSRKFIFEMKNFLLDGSRGESVEQAPAIGSIRGAKHTYINMLLSTSATPQNPSVAKPLLPSTSGGNTQHLLLKTAHRGTAPLEFPEIPHQASATRPRSGNTPREAKIVDSKVRRAPEAKRPESSSGPFEPLASTTKSVSPSVPYDDPDFYMDPYQEPTRNNNNSHRAPAAAASGNSGSPRPVAQDPVRAQLLAIPGGIDHPERLQSAINNEIEHQKAVSTPRGPRRAGSISAERGADTTISEGVSEALQRWVSLQRRQRASIFSRPPSPGTSPFPPELTEPTQVQRIALRASILGQRSGHDSWSPSAGTASFRPQLHERTVVMPISASTQTEWPGSSMIAHSNVDRTFSRTGRGELAFIHCHPIHQRRARSLSPYYFAEETSIRDHRRQTHALAVQSFLNMPHESRDRCATRAPTAVVDHDGPGCAGIRPADDASDPERGANAESEDAGGSKLCEVPSVAQGNLGEDQKEGNVPVAA